MRQKFDLFIYNKGISHRVAQKRNDIGTKKNKIIKFELNVNVK